MSELIPLFATPLYKEILKNTNELQIKDYIRNMEYNTVDNMGSENLFISKNVDILNDPLFLPLKKEILQTFKFYSEDLIGIQVDENCQFYIICSWVNKLLPGGKGRQHNHNFSIFSGVCYLDVDENSSHIAFHNNLLSNIFYEQMPLPIKETHYNLFNSEWWSLPVEQNELLLFPSSTRHSIEINNSNKNRYSLAFDIFVRGKFKKGFHGYLELK